MKTLLLAILLLGMGCTSTKSESDELKYWFLPFPCDEFPNTAQKNTTHKDWGEDFCGI
jgi:hypothetical protein